jgi:hypothetical protein
MNVESVNWGMRRALTASFLSLVGFATSPAEAAFRIEGQVQAGGGAVANSTVTLWAGSVGDPKQLVQAKTSDDGSFALSTDETPGPGVSLYLIAKGGVASVNKGSGDNPALAFLAVLGGAPPARVTINEMTTVASVWTNAQFLDGALLEGPALSLGIAAGNAPNFVDLQTGGWGTLIQSSLNSGQTPTMAIFATLADSLAGCAARVTVNACDNLFLATTPPKGDAPTDTLTAAEAVARYPWYVPQRLFTLLGQLYPVAQGKTMRPVPFMPYLNYAPSAWVLALKVDGGGYRAGGGAEFDSEGNLWTGDNFTVGWQGDDTLWQGNATKFAPNGRPLSPMTTGFAGGGMQGGSFGLAIDAHDNAWFPTYGGKSIAVFDKNGKPLTPPDGLTFDGKLGLMQGAIATPSGDVWVVGLSKNQLVYFPGGDPTKGKLLCEGDSAEPCKSLRGPFHLAIDQQDRIWVSNALGDHVTRFPASDPSKAETFAAGYSGSGLSVDSQGNVWVGNRLGSSLRGLAKFVEVGLVAKTGGNGDEALTYKMFEQTGGWDGGSVTVLRPDGSQFPGSPFYGPSLPGPWATVIDGDDNVWVSNFAGVAGQLAHLCGVRTENCPPGFKTGEPISPPLGYVGGGLQMETDLALDPAGNVWVMNNWEDIGACFHRLSEALSTRCGGNGVTIFYGMAKPVRAPMIGPARPVQ